MLARLESTNALSMAGILMVLAIAAFSARPQPFKAQQQSAVIQGLETTGSLDLPVLPRRQRIPVDILRVIDGDTVEVLAHIWIDQQVQARIRLRSIDAPELKATCQREALLAEAAKVRLADLLTSGKAWLGDVGRDKYGGRFLGTLHDSAGRDISQLMLATGHVRTYDGRKRQAWC
jgi:endonuclease YncB( thermonuclease family)